MAGRTARRRDAACVGVACEHTLGRQPLHLYGYLWTKADEEEDAHAGTFSFVVPDTVVFKHQKPVKWFFTSKQEKGKILSKSKKHVSVTHVMQAFLEPKLGQTAPRGTDDELIVATFAYAERCSASGDFATVVEHLTKPALRHLLTNREKPALSILQRFIPTRSGYNHMIQSVFTPDSCLIRKCVNSNLVSDAAMAVAQRTVTFEADEKDVKPRDVTNRNLREQIEHMNVEISSHLQKIIGKEMVRCVTYFKIGLDSRIYLLWSTMLSFESGSRACAANQPLCLSHHDRVVFSVTNQHVEMANHSTAPLHSLTKACPDCRLVFPREQVDFLVTYKAVIRHFKFEPRDPLDDRVAIPPLLERLLSPIQGDRFKELTRDTSFLYRTVTLCQSCASKINARRDFSPIKVVQKKEAIDEAAGVLARPAAMPIYMQSAHSIFWGKVERNAALKKRANMQRRPMSAATASTRYIRADRPQWGEFTKVHGGSYNPTSIDMDVLDGMLSVYASRREQENDVRPTTSPRKQAVQLQKPVMQSMPLQVPARPAVQRAPSNRLGRSMRSTLYLRHSIEPKEDMEQKRKSISTEVMPSNQCNNERSSQEFTRILGDIECRVHISATIAGSGEDYALYVQATPLNATEKLAPDTMSITVDTTQILHLLEQQHKTAECLQDSSALVVIVLDHLTVEGDRLSLRSSTSQSPEPSTSTQSTHSISSPSSDDLTPEELLVLRETLRHAS
ncbi:hypothetical protein Poli38472_006265 [Pythium oligandrum]|uniref:Uncharacterized protein n=1 Tax=Pythium oligandrum TaxID=41045 RepID=A0A8K1CS14_PYTOL|nr:hypothetical protein Poli38472_006265 [Pythium oligandrum]|eukprot:TMW68797.1 hypothetical protein Poli38472_006265 [Pythium oligandrum]